MWTTSILEYYNYEDNLWKFPKLSNLNRYQSNSSEFSYREKTIFPMLAFDARNLIVLILIVYWKFQASESKIEILLSMPMKLLNPHSLFLWIFHLRRAFYLEFCLKTNWILCEFEVYSEWLQVNGTDRVNEVCWYGHGKAKQANPWSTYNVCGVF